MLDEVSFEAVLPQSFSMCVFFLLDICFCNRQVSSSVPGVAPLWFLYLKVPHSVFTGACSETISIRILHLLPVNETLQSHVLNHILPFS